MPPRPEGASTVAGPARLGKRTKLLVRRLETGDVAVIDHRDLDRVSGEDLLAAGVSAVVNCSPFSSGSYPNMGPLLLAQGGIPLLETDFDLFSVLEDGDLVELRGDELLRDGRVVATGHALTAPQLVARTEALRADIGEALEAFARNNASFRVTERATRRR